MVIKNLLRVKRLSKLKHFTSILIIYITDLHHFQTLSVLSVLSLITARRLLHHLRQIHTPSSTLNIIYSYPHSHPIHSDSISDCPSPNVDFKSTLCNNYFPTVTLWYATRLGISLELWNGIYSMPGHRKVSHLALELDGCRKGENEDDIFIGAWYFAEHILLISDLFIFNYCYRQIQITSSTKMRFQRRQSIKVEKRTAINKYLSSFFHVNANART